MKGTFLGYEAVRYDTCSEFLDLLYCIRRHPDMGSSYAIFHSFSLRTCQKLITVQAHCVSVDMD
jgi:hypothetical protein